MGLINHSMNLNGDLTINNGNLNASNSYDTININGSWTENRGINGFTEGIGTVNFIGSEESIITGTENFNTLTVNKTGSRQSEQQRDNLLLTFADNSIVNIANNLNIYSGEARVMNNCTLDIGEDLAIGENNFNIFSFTSSSSVHVTGAIDLDILGDITIEVNGNLTTNSEFYQNGTVYINGGNFLIHGSYGLETDGSLQISDGSLICDAAYQIAPQDINGEFIVDGGLFEFTNRSIYISSTCSESINGGIIRTGGNFYANTANTFQANGGTVEFIGNREIQIDCSKDNGNYFHNLTINKSGDNAYLIPETLVKGDVAIVSGTLVNEENPLYVEGD